MRNRASKIDILLGARLRQLRKAKKLSLQELGDKIGVSYQQVGKYERGGNRMSVAVFIEVCRVLEADPGSIVAQLYRARP